MNHKVNTSLRRAHTRGHIVWDYGFNDGRAKCWCLTNANVIWPFDLAFIWTLGHKEKNSMVKSWVLAMDDRRLPQWARTRLRTYYSES